MLVFWDGKAQMKSQRALAKGARAGIREDVRLLDYYRYNFVSFCCESKTYDMKNAKRDTHYF